MTALGVYVGNDRDALARYSAWLGEKPDYVHGVVGYADWNDYVNSAGWQAWLWKDSGVAVQWSVPIISRAGDLATAATGSYNDYHRQVAEAIVKGTPGNGPIMIRTGWEANSDWFFWSAVGKEEAFKGAFQQMVTAFREVSDRFVFEWNINYAHDGIDPATMYPGDDYVDIVGMDFYYHPQYFGNDPVRAFNWIQNAKYGLDWFEGFAKEHGKPTAYSEWGATGAGAARFIELAKGWFAKHDVLLQSYWDSNGDYPGMLSDGTNPAAGAAYRAAFGHDGSPVTWDDLGLLEPPPPPPPIFPVLEPPPTSGRTTTTIAGTARAETLTGTAGNDAITGGGKDTLVGGDGDDTYTVAAGDVVVERAGGGTDTVKTWVDGYALPDHVENLVVSGSGANKVFGNALDNRITGNGAANVIDGRGGDDYLTGKGGADTFIIAKGEGNDTITDFDGAAGDVLVLDGFSFQDFAAVRAAAVQVKSDLVIRLGDGQALKLMNVALDELRADDVSLINVQAPPPVQQAVAPVAAKLQLGTAGRDNLTGTGGERLMGGDGNDTYNIAPGDIVVERAGGGNDTVKTWIDNYVLPDHVENLKLSGTKGISGFGNGLDNRITGNVGANRLDGGAGDDTLTGGAGDDTFVIGKGQGHDTVTDFEGAGAPGGDILLLKGFGAGATIVHEGGGVYAIHSAGGATDHVTLQGVTNLARGDYAWA